MTYADEDLRIGVGYNVALEDLVLISSITPSTADPFAPPKSIPLVDDGEITIKVDGMTYNEGFICYPWFWTRLSYQQYSYLKYTICSGGNSGQVTIYTTTGEYSGDNPVYDRFNAIMILKKASELSSEYRFMKVDVEFTRIAPAA